jgi:hypothetical protein
LDLGMVKSLQVTDTLRVNKYDSLFLSFVHPQDKVRIEAACLKEANTLAAFVVKQKDFLFLGSYRKLCYLCSENS